MAVEPLCLKASLDLPQFQATWGLKKVCVADAPLFLILGGRPPETEWLKSCSQGRELWAADAGARACRQAGLIPQRLIGDFYILDQETLAWMKARGVKPEQHPVDKDLTDFQLTLSEAGKGGRSSVVSGCWGGRFDHALSNVYSGLWAREWGSDVLALADEKEALVYVTGGEAVTFHFHRRPQFLSLLALTPCKGIDLSGVRWPLSGVDMTPTQPYAVSNRAEQDSIDVALKEGHLALYFVFDTIQM